MPMSTQAPATRMSLIYITAGSVIVVWTVVWLLYLMNNPPSTGSTYYFVFGFMATGAVVLAIGLRLGSIGRAAKQAENPPVVQQTIPTEPQQIVVATPDVSAPPAASAIAAPPAANVVTAVPAGNVVFPQAQSRVQYTS
jgi:hypothetical protein